MFHNHFKHFLPKLIKPYRLLCHYGSNYAFVVIYLVKKIKLSIVNYVHSYLQSSTDLLLLSASSLTEYLVLREKMR